MHLAEGVLPLGQALLWSAVAAPVLAWSLRGERHPSGEQAELAEQTTLVAGATSLLFAVTLLPLPVPVVGATSHICLTPLLAILIGLRRIVWPTFFVLLLQALFFAHGGLTTLGINLLTLGVVGPLVALAVAGVGRRVGMPPLAVIGIACATADLAVYVVDAAALAAGLAASIPPARTFTAVVLGFAPIQVPLAMLEAAISIGLVRLLARRRADLLPAWLRSARCTARDRSKQVVLLAVTIMVLVSGCRYEGIDASVFGAAAAAAGRPPLASMLDFSVGELGLAMSIIVLFCCGFVAGRTYERLLRRDQAPGN